MVYVSKYEYGRPIWRYSTIRMEDDVFGIVIFRYDHEANYSRNPLMVVIRVNF